MHSAKVVYSNGSRVGKCGVGGELWHRDAVAFINLLLRARLGGLPVGGSPVPLGSTATHDPTGVPKSLWARRKPLDATSEYGLIRMSI